MADFSYETDRFWYSPKDGKIHQIPFNTHIHADYVKRNPTKFGFKDRATLKKLAGALDEYPINFATMKNGWVRVFRNRRNPDVDTSIEATDIESLQRAVKKVFPFVRIYVGLRTGPSQHDVKSYVLDKEAGRKFIATGALPTNESVEEPNELMLLDVMRRLSGITT